MAVGNANYLPAKSSGALTSIFWYVLAVVACLSVFLINRTPLVYFDTFAYLNRGLFLVDMVKDVLGIDTAADTGQVAPNQTPAETAVFGSKALDGTPSNAGRTISASRSRAYSFVLGVLATFRVLSLATVLNAVLVIFTAWLVGRVAVRQLPSAASLAPTVVIPLLVAALGSLPFFVAYLMPDIYAPVLILVLGLLAVFAREMNRWEILVAVMLGSFAVMAHITHLAIAASMIPVVAIISRVLEKRRWWLAPSLVSFVVVFGVAEQATYKVAVEARTDFEAVFQPFITARLIQDRVGYEYLQRHCPDATITTCDLYEALSKSDDPMRLTASHVMFRRSQELGSFLLMSESSRRAVSEAQFRFFFDVLKEFPARTAVAMLRNTLDQVRLNRVEQTVNNSARFVDAAGSNRLGLDSLGFGPLTSDLSWLDPITKFHRLLYVVSFLVISLLVLWPGALPKQLRAFAVVILLGILANAFICGAISQPAARYGGRVIWLLPFTAALCLLFSPLLMRRISLGGYRNTGAEQPVDHG